MNGKDKRITDYCITKVKDYEEKGYELAETANDAIRKAKKFEEKGYKTFITAKYISNLTFETYKKVLYAS